jgi:predicted dehydrogenase
MPAKFEAPMNRTKLIVGLTAVALSGSGGAAETVRLLTLDPGHFHAALVQKEMYPQVSPLVHIYAPAGPDLEAHLKRIEGFNTRSENPTRWETRTITDSDFFDRMCRDKAGNVVVISGNNARKGDYILRSVQAGFNVLADKPMAIHPADFAKVKQAFQEADRRGVLLYDLMTERYEITTLLQRELSRVPGIFGKLEKGTPAQPAITKESVHYYFKHVSGKPLQRPPWFFDVTQQGEGMVDVTTHLVDLIQWEAFPDRRLKPADVKMLAARRWITKLNRAQFQQITAATDWPDYLKASVNATDELEVYGNGEFTYTLRGIHAKVSVIWDFQAPPGAADSHYSIMRGTRADLIIRQGPEQNYKTALYVEKKSKATDTQFEQALQQGIARLQQDWPGVAVKKVAGGWEIVIPEAFRIGHEAHFAQVTEKYLRYLAAGKLPAWEVPNMITKYHTIMEAYRLSR